VGLSVDVQGGSGDTRSAVSVDGACVGIVTLRRTMRFIRSGMLTERHPLA
jgi:hypothetical protein